MNSSLFKVNVKDFAKGLAVAVIVVVLGSVQQAFETNGLNVAAFDWAGIVNTALTAAVAYLGKNLLSDEDGKVFGKIG